MHAAHGMTGVVEIMHEREGQTMALRQPFYRRRGPLRHHRDNCRIGLGAGFAPNFGGKNGGLVGDAKLPLEACVGRGDQSGRKRRRPARRAIALEHDNLRVSLARRQRGAQSGRPRANDQHLRHRLKGHARRVLHKVHEALNWAMASPIVTTGDTGSSAATAVS